MLLSVIVTVYNEVNTILCTLEQVGKVSIEKEIIIVDDCSTDGTKELLQEKFGSEGENLKLVYHAENKGKGAAIQTALLYTKGEYSIFQDADLEYDPQDYTKLMEAAQKHKLDVVYGSRFLKTWRVTSFWHFLVNRFLTGITNLLYGSRLTDMETCYKMIKTKLLKELGLKSQRFNIEPEITVKLLKKGYNIKEAPIFYKGRSYTEGKKITWKDGFSAVWSLLRYRFTE